MKPLPNHFVSSIIDMACSIQAIPAPTFYETKRAAFFLKQFASLNLVDVHLPQVQTGIRAGTDCADPGNCYCLMIGQTKDQ